MKYKKDVTNFLLQTNFDNLSVLKKGEKSLRTTLHKCVVTIVLIPIIGLIIAIFPKAYSGGNFQAYELYVIPHIIGCINTKEAMGICYNPSTLWEFAFLNIIEAFNIAFLAACNYWFSVLIRFVQISLDQHIEKLCQQIQSMHERIMKELDEKEKEIKRKAEKLTKEGIVFKIIWNRKKEYDHCMYSELQSYITEHQSITRLFFFKLLLKNLFPFSINVKHSVFSYYSVIL